MNFFIPKSFNVYLLLCLCLACVGGCASADAGDVYFGKVTPPEGQTLRYITGTEPETLDPQKMTGQSESRIALALFDGLVEYDDKGVNPIPSLATNWDTNRNGTVWTFHLRHNARWTDGTPLTAHDFVYSWRRALTPELAAPYASYMYVVRFGEAYNNDSAFVRDSQTGKFATVADMERAGKDGEVVFTGATPRRSDEPQTDTDSASATESTPVKYFFVPADADARNLLVTGDPAKKKPPQPELARFIQGKEFVPITKEYVGVRALDDYTFQVTLESPTAYFIKLVLHQFFRPVPRQAIEKSGDKLWSKQGNMVSSGGFRLVEWTPYDKVVVERNPFHWDVANTRLERIVFPTVEDVTTGMSLYKAGEVDAVQTNTVPTPWRNQLKETKRDYMYGPMLYVEYLAIKTMMPPMTDVRVRKALSLAINRQILADRAPGQLGLTVITPPMDGYEAPQGSDYNPDEARRLLAAAGFPNGQGFPEIEILYNTNENNKQLYELIQAMLKRELNIPVVLTNQEQRVFLVNIRAGALNYKGLARRGWVADYADPNAFLELFTSGSDNNATGFKDPKYDQMLSLANAETDPAKRAEKLRSTESYLLDLQPVIPLVVKPLAWVKKPYVRGMENSPLDQHNWRLVYIDHDWRADNSDARQSVRAE